MNYKEALDYLSGLKRFGIKFGLDRFAELCRRMGNPEESLRVIHVGGTNGKGSTCTFIASILKAAGYSVGTYLSPYVFDVRERIQVNGEMISEEDFATLMSEIVPVLEEVGQTEFGEGTEFEAKTLMAFMHFAKVNVDFAVIEVGMGGRYDATNVVNPLVSVITNVSLDHTDRLGDTIPKIAWDKSGIAKPGVPLVTAANAECGVLSAERGMRSAELDDAWRTIATTAREQGVKEVWRVVRKGCVPPADSPRADVNVLFSGDDGIVEVELPEVEFDSLRIPHSTLCTPLRLPGEFQITNAATAAAAVAALRGMGVEIPDSAIVEGLASAYLPGRMEVLRRNPTVVIDAAHNPDGAQKLAESVPKFFSYKRLILVVGMLSTHSAEDVLGVLAPLADEIIATKSQWEKARPAEEVAEAAKRLNPNVRVIEPVPAAVDAALESSREDDLILITGSFYTIGEVDREVVATR